MMLSRLGGQRWRKRVLLSGVIWGLLFVTVSTLWLVRSTHIFAEAQEREEPPPLVREYIDYGQGIGGRWYIPTSWQRDAVAASTDEHPLISKLHPTNAIEAAELALELAIRSKQYLANSKIPLVSHQTWRDFNIHTWPKVVEESVQGWLQTASGNSGNGTQMAYILWDDEGIDMLMERFEPDLWEAFASLPYPVEKADTFRIAVLRWFGGVYTDVDVKLLQHPIDWVHDSDLADWTDTDTETTYSVQVPRVKKYVVPPVSLMTYQKLLSSYTPPAVDVGAIFGIEADNPPNTDAYWRMGYSYPLQITNWAVALAPHHPTASGFLSQLTTDIALNATRLPSIDPLDLTGPPALTRSVMHYCESTLPDFRWNALSGRADPVGGRGKVAAGDVLILPITGFSPGRGRFHNMGSQPTTHPNARLLHMAAGTWRKLDVNVEIGKLCRTVLGRCKDWSKIPQPPLSR